VEISSDTSWERPATARQMAAIPSSPSALPAARERERERDIKREREKEREIKRERTRDEYNKESTRRQRGEKEEKE